MDVRSIFSSKWARFAAIAILAVVITLSLPSYHYKDRDALIKNVPEMSKCSQASDCILSTVGACDPKCPVALNREFLTLWEKTPASQDFSMTCALGSCMLGFRTFVAGCVNQTCTPVVAPESPTRPTSSTKPPR
jgi:hypothetical protein